MIQLFWKKTKLQKSFYRILTVLYCEISREHSDQILSVIRTFETHPSILKIKKLNSGCRFSFENESLKDVKKVTRELDILKASQHRIILQLFFVNINHSINNNTFPEQLKLADVKPIFKKNSYTDKENCRSVSTLPNISKI